MIRDIVQLPSPILRQTARKVHRQRKEFIQQVLTDLIDTARDNQALGLAAPQIGVSLRIAVIKVGDQYHRLVNPEITLRAGTTIGTEGCLSLPSHLRVNVERAARINFKDKYGRSRAEGLLARIVQHELDHLDGILILDKEVVDATAQEAGTESEVL